MADQALSVKGIKAKAATMVLVLIVRQDIEYLWQMECLE